MTPEILKCIGRAVVRRAALALARGRPVGEAVCDVADDVMKEWAQQRGDLRDRHAELEALARAPASEARRQAEEVAAEVAPPDVRRALAAYLEQVPEAVRRSFARPGGPAGLTAPAGLSLREGRDLLAFLPPRAPHFQPGDRPLPGVDRELEKLLGIGGFGEVWKARNPRDPGEAPVALKFCFDEDALRVLRHEQTVLGRALKHGSHRGIVALRQAYLDAEPYCLEYEYVEGGDLARQIREWAEEAPAARAEACLGLMRDLVDVVAFAHGLSPPVVHRDLKPANILLPRSTGGPAVRVTDFGIGGLATRQAKAQTQTSRSYEANLLTRLRGAFTPLYASPQQLLGEEPDPRDDVHALGVIWYQMLTGDLRARLPADWRFILEERGVPPEAIELLNRCLASKPERRLANAIDLARELAKLEPAPARVTNSIGMQLAQIPSGTFVMGSPAGEADRSGAEGPQHEVAISRPFYLGVFPVTQEQWQRVMGSNPSYFSSGGRGKEQVRGLDTRNFPVESVSWEDAVAFCRKLSELPEQKQKKQLYRLPSEAEWEYACRGGAASSTPFHFGTSLSSTQANFNGNYPYGGAAQGPYLERTTEVGAYQVSNAFGLYDLHGNVLEWCADWYDDNYYASSPRNDPAGPREGSDRVFRGGGWYYDGWVCRSADRGGSGPGSRISDLGFRVALVPSGG